MNIILKIIEFLCSSVAVFLTWVLIMNIISSIINPKITIENGAPVEQNNNARLMFALIIAICWAIIIIIP